MNYAVFLPQLKQQLVFHQGANSTSLEFDKKNQACAQKVSGSIPRLAG